MNYYKTHEGQLVLKEVDKLETSFMTILSRLEDLTNDIVYDMETAKEEDKSYFDTDECIEKEELLEAIVDMRDKIDRDYEEVKDYILYDNNAFDDAY
tara:strand:- start:748 stop:1038 length:291 start_codon:yes stop_codon:yes gene_type:complete